MNMMRGNEIGRVGWVGCVGAAPYRAGDVLWFAYPGLQPGL